MILDENNKLNEQADHFTKELRCSHQLLQEYKSKERVLEDRIEEEMQKGVQYTERVKMVSVERDDLMTSCQLIQRQHDEAIEIHHQQ